MWYLVLKGTSCRKRKQKSRSLNELSKASPKRPRQQLHPPPRKVQTVESLTRASALRDLSGTAARKEAAGKAQRRDSQRKALAKGVSSSKEEEKVLQVLVHHWHASSLHASFLLMKSCIRKDGAHIFISLPRYSFAITFRMLL